ncbi:hypothetical protein L218DRAFT_944099 [Marasmius fiardii PR-910]|nr:hypothetical protein L218DRAFT_944099 [Marasmius fiardii PR-910]
MSSLALRSKEDKTVNFLAESSSECQCSEDVLIKVAGIIPPATTTQPGRPGARFPVAMTFLNAVGPRPLSSINCFSFVANGRSAIAFKDGRVMKTVGSNWRMVWLMERKLWFFGSYFDLHIEEYDSDMKTRRAIEQTSQSNTDSKAALVYLSFVKAGWSNPFRISTEISSIYCDRPPARIMSQPLSGINSLIHVLSVEYRFVTYLEVLAFRNFGLRTMGIVL